MNRTQEPLFKKGEPKRIAVFDIDGTLVGSEPDELSGEIYWHMKKKGLLKSKTDTSSTLEVLRNRYLSDPTDSNHRTYLNNFNAAFDNEVVLNKPSTILAIARHVLRDVEIFPIMKQEISKFREAEIPIVYATGTPGIVAKAFANRTGATLCLGSHYPHSGNRFLPGRQCESRGSNKEAYLRSLLVDLSLRTMSDHTKALLGYGDGPRPDYGAIPEDERVEIAAGYGNTTSDLGIFNLSAESIAVNPRGPLKVIAMANNWRTIHAKSVAASQYDIAA